MNREVLFKAKRKDNGEWVEGYLMDENYINTPFNDWDACGRFDDPIEIDPDTLCQYTGLTDKSGQKIWENDVLCGHLDEEYHENITYKKVVWDMNGFYTKEECSTFDPLDEFDEEYFEVCGNIFDNPELLEV